MVAQPQELRPIPNLPETDLAVTEWESHDSRNHRYGSVSVDRLKLNDGETYEVHFGEPFERQTDVPVVKTTAWMTGLEGHNKQQMLKLMKLGYPVMMLGPEGYIPDGRTLKEHWQAGQAVTLRSSAEHMLAIYRHIKPAQLYDESRLALYGESRAAMIGFSLLKMAESQPDIDIVHAEIVAPCFAQKFTRRDVGRFTLQVAQEPLAIAKDVRGLARHGLRHNLKTVPLQAGAGYFVHAAALARTLFGGEVGDVARSLSPETATPINVTLLSRDYSSQVKTWQAIFENSPNVTVEVQRGSHLSIPDTLQRTTAHFAELLAGLNSQPFEAA